MWKPPRHLAHLFPPPGCEDVMRWRNNALARALHRRDSFCWVGSSECLGFGSIHEVITRGDVMGWQPPERRLVIYNGINSLKLCSVHHNTALEPGLVEVFDWMAEQYGLDVVFGWVTSLKFKGKHPALEWINGVVSGWGALDRGLP